MLHQVINDSNDKYLRAPTCNHPHGCDSPCPMVYRTMQQTHVQIRSIIYQRSLCLSLLLSSCISFIDLDEGLVNSRDTIPARAQVRTRSGHPPCSLVFVLCERFLMHPRGLRSRAYVHRHAREITGPARDLPRSKSIASRVSSGQSQRKREKGTPSGLSPVRASHLHQVKMNGEVIQIAATFFLCL